MEWRHSDSPRPKKFRVQKSLENFSPRFFGIKTALSSLIIFQSAKLSTWSITHLCWCNWREFWRKNAAGSSRRGSCSRTIMPRLTGHLQPRRNWPTWASIFLITHPILRIWPRRTTTCSLDWKKQLKGRHFSSDAEVIAAAGTWLEGQLPDFFFEWLAKVEKTQWPTEHNCRKETRLPGKDWLRGLLLDHLQLMDSKSGNLFQAISKPD